MDYSGILVFIYITFDTYLLEHKQTVVKKNRGKWGSKIFWGRGFKKSQLDSYSSIWVMGGYFVFCALIPTLMCFPSGTVVKNPPANVGDSRDVGSIPESGRSPGMGNGNPLQYSMDRESHGQRSLVGCCLWGQLSLDTESDTTEAS